MHNYDNYEIETQKKHTEFSRLYGENKVRKIENKIRASKHTAGLLGQSLMKKTAPTILDFQAAVLGNFSFSMSKTTTVRFATLILIEKWHWEVNHILGLLNDEDMCNLLEDIYKKVN